MRDYIVASSRIALSLNDEGLAWEIAPRRAAALARSHMTEVNLFAYSSTSHSSTDKHKKESKLNRSQAMAIAGSEARMRFLGQAADALAVTAPTVSSYIRATKRSVDPSQATETTAFENVCNACGQALLVGWSCEPVRSAEHRQTRQQRLSGNDTTTRCVKCSACGTESIIHQKKRMKMAKSAKLSQPTEVPVGLPARKKNNISTPPPEPEPVPMQVPTPKENTPEPPQAKPAARRKARNKNASLQALLANKKPEVPKSSGYGLDFMDFMK